MGTNTKVICSRSKIDAIADAIRERNEVQTTFTLDSMATAVSSLHNKYVVNFTGATPNATITATDGIHTYTAESDANGAGTLYVFTEGNFLVTDSTQSITRSVTFSNDYALQFARLPAEYKEVEYIQNTSTSYLDTGLVSTADQSVEVEFSFDDLNNNYAIFGGRNTQLTNTYTLFFLKTNMRFDCNGQKSVVDSNSGIIQQYTSHIYRFTYDAMTGIAVAENTTTGAFQTTAIGTASTFTTYPIVLFGVNTSASISLQLKGKVYSCVFKRGQSKVMELIPCYRKADNKAGMYDVVNGVFYGGSYSTTPISTDRWEYEYSLNNSSFTAEQWLAINSGLAQHVTSVGFDANAVQVLKNINGTLTWVTET